MNTRRRRWVVPALVAIGVGAAGLAWAFRPADPARLLAEAEASYRAGRNDEAEATLARLDRRGAIGPEAAWLRAHVATARRRPGEALAALDHIPDGHPLAARAWLLRGQSERDLGRARRAEEALRHALRLDPTLVQARRELIFIDGLQLRRRDMLDQFRALADLIPLGPGDVLSWCLTRGDVWDPAEVQGRLETFVKNDPEDRRSRLALAECLRQRSRLDEAEAALAPLTAADPDARAGRARIAMDRGDDGTVAALLADGPADHPGMERLRGSLAMAGGDAESAARHYRAVLAAEPDDRDAVAGLGRALGSLGRGAEARPWLDRAAAADRLATLLGHVASSKAPLTPDLARELGAACEGAGQLPEARAWYRLVIARDPADRDAQAALARIDEAIARPKADGR
ncbi:MAG TPA: tetratricopeptide repeat protein [Isosphaeraceae bacterium]|jgi:tetratricopeptide (TPR) repeat protein|nr:tetratricopeptide repeat protein [Isosphaeraceae bacterium]